MATPPHSTLMGHNNVELRRFGHNRSIGRAAK
jgi:hypothetical protein